MGEDSHVGGLVAGLMLRLFPHPKVVGSTHMEPNQNFTKHKGCHVAAPSWATWHPFIRPWHGKHTECDISLI
jgi:hypothetical protein